MAGVRPEVNGTQDGQDKHDLDEQTDCQNDGATSARGPFVVRNPLSHDGFRARELAVGEGVKREGCGRREGWNGQEMRVDRGGWLVPLEGMGLLMRHLHDSGNLFWADWDAGFRGAVGNHRVGLCIVHVQ